MSEIAYDAKDTRIHFVGLPYDSTALQDFKRRLAAGESFSVVATRDQSGDPKLQIEFDDALFHPTQMDVLL